jgi:glutathione S-transferase
MSGKANIAYSALGEIKDFVVSALGLNDPIARLRALASTGTSLLRVNRGTIVKGHGKTPKNPLELFEAEYCPYCRHVREALTELDLDAMIYPVPKGGKRHRDRLVELGGKAKVPFLHDPNTGTRLYESEAIVQYLYKQYGLEWAEVPQRWLATSTLASLSRGKSGMFARPSRAPGKPLELYSFESSPYSRLVRERMCELELPYLLHNCGKTPGSHADYLPPEYRGAYVRDYMPGTENRRKFLQRAGRIMMPYLIDPNTGKAMFETRDIEAYLERTYGAGVDAAAAAMPQERPTTERRKAPPRRGKAGAAKAAKAKAAKAKDEKSRAGGAETAKTARKRARVTAPTAPARTGA